MKLIPLLTAAVLPLVLSSCYTDGYGYVGTGTTYYPRSYGSYHYPGYYGGHYASVYSRPHYYSSGHYSSGHRYYRNDYRYGGHSRRYRDRDGHHDGRVYQTNVHVGGWRPRRD